MDRLIHVLEGIRKRGLILEYVETNGFWIREPDARERLERVRGAGCSCLLLSISPFHNAFLSCRENRRAYQMIVDVFGPRGIFPWHPGYYPFLEQLDPDRAVPFREYADRSDPRELEIQLTGISYLHPAGRAAWTLSGLMPTRPAEAWFGKNCRAELSSPVHAHADYCGHYLAGFCSGLQVGNRAALDLQGLIREGISLLEHPLLEMLVQETLGDLARNAEKLGFRENPQGYVSCCHLCGHIRTWLYHHLPPEKRPKELAPSCFYEEMIRLIRPRPLQKT